MLKKDYKLKSFEIKYLFNKKDTSFKIKRGVFFDIKIFYSDIISNNNLKSAIIISKKTFKKAIERNKIRRIIYSILEKNNKNNNLKDIIIFFPKKDIKNIKFQDLEKEVYNTLINLNN